MLKKISGLCASAACLLGLCTTAFADGPIGNAVNGAVNAGEDIADGIFNAGNDLVDGITGSGRTGSADGDENSDVGDLTTPDDNTASDDNTGSDTDTSGDPDTENSGSNAIGDDSDSSISATESGAGSTGENPGTGNVVMGYAAISAVLAAMGVTLSSIRRKQD